MARMLPIRTFPDEQPSNLGSVVDRRTLGSAEPRARVPAGPGGRSADLRFARCWASGAGTARRWRPVAVPSAPGIAARGIQRDLNRTAGLA